MEKNVDPWALLREAKRLIAANRLMLGHYSGVREVGNLEDRIDAALAERQDSAKSEMESDAVEWSRVGRWSATTVGDVFCQVQRGVDLWNWDISQTGQAPTEAEAKSAVIAAARGMK
jgi:hypothetical protein